MSKCIFRVPRPIIMINYSVQLSKCKIKVFIICIRLSDKSDKNKDRINYNDQ